MDMVGEHRNLMHVHRQSLGGRSDNLYNVAGVDSAYASGTQPRMPRDVGEDTERSVRHARGVRRG